MHSKKLVCRSVVASVWYVILLKNGELRSREFENQDVFESLVDEEVIVPIAVAVGFNDTYNALHLVFDNVAIDEAHSPVEPLKMLAEDVSESFLRFHAFAASSDSEYFDLATETMDALDRHIAETVGTEVIFHWPTTRHSDLKFVFNGFGSSTMSQPVLKRVFSEVLKTFENERAEH